MMATLLTVAAGGVICGSAIAARHRAQSAADLAALAAAADLASGPAGACRAARRLAQRTAADAVDCAVDGLDVIVRVDVNIGPLARIPGAGRASAIARAGPGAAVPP